MRPHPRLPFDSFSGFLFRPLIGDGRSARGAPNILHSSLNSLFLIQPPFQIVTNMSCDVYELLTIRVLDGRHWYCRALFWSFGCLFGGEP